ncbi:MAG TPA: hypothetical protein VGB83_08395 [Actinomycetota bacterium]
MTTIDLAKDTAKKTLFAAVGAGTTALDKARELPERVISLPTTLSTRVEKIRSNGAPRLKIGDLRKTVREFGQAVPERATKVYEDLSKRGEEVLGKVQKQAPKAKAKTAKAPAKEAEKAEA